MPTPVVAISGRAEPFSLLSKSVLHGSPAPYVQAVQRSGGAPVILPPHSRGPALRAVFDRSDALILSGGGDIFPDLYGEDDSGLLWRVDRQRDESELLLARWAIEEDRPLLAICRGSQVLNVAAGGTLFQDISTQVPGALVHSSIEGRPAETTSHAVRAKPDTLLAKVLGAGEQDVNSSHHQSVKDLGHGLVVAALAEDGVIEAIEAPERSFCVGVQWHPELLLDTHPAMKRLFDSFICAARGT
jgi:putative glutamine amidotransferase